MLGRDAGFRGTPVRTDYWPTSMLFNLSTMVWDLVTYLRLWHPFTSHGQLETSVCNSSSCDLGDKDTERGVVVRLFTCRMTHVLHLQHTQHFIKQITNTYTVYMFCNQKNMFYFSMLIVLSFKLYIAGKRQWIIEWRAVNYRQLRLSNTVSQKRKLSARNASCQVTGFVIDASSVVTVLDDTKG